MWRRLLDPVSTIEAVLVIVVVEANLLGFAPSPSARRLCAWGALILMVGCGCAAVAWLRSLLPRRTGITL
jgi:hypothetical protein